MSLGRNSLTEHRFVVETATLDELDHQYQQRYFDATTDRAADISVASTVDVDNTHPYLMRYADIYANDCVSDAGSSMGGTAGLKFVDVKPLSQYKEGQKVIYNSSDGSPAEAIIMKVIYNNGRQPQYTIRLATGDEQQADGDNLNKKTAGGATEANGEPPSIFKCVNFKKNPTGLFISLYRGMWHQAQEHLQSHPEEASVWVARYGKKKTASNIQGEVRWQLLPLHLYIALCGRGNDEATKQDEDEDVPDDEKDEIEVMEKESEDAKTPPLQLLTALLSAYPQATQSTDDQSMTPLHSAIRGNSSPAIIKKLLEADPSSVYRKDARGRNAFILAEKVFGKRIHKVQVGNEDKVREQRYAKLMELLSDTARRVSSPVKSQPKGDAVRDMVQKATVEKEQDEDVENKIIVEKPEELTQKQHIRQLRNENLTLRRENAELHHRAEINARLLEQLVEKLQMYENERSIENYNDIFGTKDELCERRQEILLSISEDDKDDILEEVTKVEEGEEENEKIEDANHVGGEGAYHKRLKRYMHHTPTRSEGNISIITPVSTFTEATEPATPTSPATPLMLLPKLGSADEDDVFDDTTCENDEGKGLEGHAVDSTADEVEIKHDADETPSATACEDIASGEDVVGKDGEETGSRVTSASDQSSVTNTEVQNIFRPRNIAPAQDHLLDNDVAHESGKLAPDVADADADDFAAKTAPLESSTTPKPEVTKETAGPKIPMATKTAEPELLRDAEDTDQEDKVVAEVAEETADSTALAEPTPSSKPESTEDADCDTKAVSKVSLLKMKSELSMSDKTDTSTKLKQFTSDEDGNDVSSNSPAIPPTLSMEEEDQLQVE